MKCLLCAGDRYEVVTRKLRHDVQRCVVRCSGCGLVSLEDPLGETLDYSQAEYRKQHGPVLGKETTPSELYAMSLPLQSQRCERLRHLLSPDAEVLEVGASTGHFLQTIRQLVRSVAGIEPNPSHAAFARERGLNVLTATLETAELEERKFDVLVMFQVLEHVADPLPFLAHCRRLLRPNGVIYLEVPNLHDSLLAVYDVPAYRKFYYRVPHVYYYSAPTLLRMMQRAGFDGRSASAQAYSLYNHVHWLHHAGPQPTQAAAYGVPQWTPPAASEEVSAEIRRWMKEADAGYKSLLAGLGVGDLLYFEGRQMTTSDNGEAVSGT